MVNGASSENGRSSARGRSADETERLLDAWLQATTIIRNDRFVKELTYNESIICRLLTENAAAGGEGLTATDLCAATQMKKSQMNRTLTAMEERALIARTTAKDDHRKQLVTIDPSQMDRFKEQHKRIIAFVGAVMDELGPQRSQELESALTDLTKAVRAVNEQD